jgi:DNA excision repair protein ERCC-3
MSERRVIEAGAWDELQDRFDLPEEFIEAFEERSNAHMGDVHFFESSREIIAVAPTEDELRKLSSVAHLETSADDIYKFQVREMDIWNTDLDLDEIQEAFRQILRTEYPNFMEWVERTYERQEVYTITKEGMHYVLKASSPERMQYARGVDRVADNLVTELSNTKSQIDFGSESRAEIKRALLDKGFPVQDEYAFDEVDESIGAELTCELRPYQKEMLEEAWERRACVLANPSGSGKTVTAIGMIARADSPTLILVPQRSLIPQWKEEILDKTSLGEDQIGEYHGDTKEMNDITIATYHIAGRKTSLFQEDWGLIIFDEVHHIPSKVFRKTARLQSKRRLGLSASPVREDSKERDIFTLIGPAIGGEWGFFFHKGHVLKPDVSIHFVDWDSIGYRKKYENAEGINKQIVASMNPRKETKLEELLAAKDGEKTVIFCDWLDQAEGLSEEFDIPFVTGETDHDRREEILGQFRDGEIDRMIISRVGDEGLDIPDAEVAIVMSGQGGSRRQATQRAGRVMRPEGGAEVHFVATKGSVEEDFVKRQMQLMKEKGINITVEGA